MSARPSSRLARLALLAMAVAAALAVAVSPAAAQSTTTGALQGVVKDASSKEALAGVTVVVSTADQQGTQTAITDGRGFFRVTGLVPGTYVVTFYYGDLTVTRKGVTVGAQKATPVYQDLRTDQAGGEVITITDAPPTIDPTSTTQGITLDKDYLRNTPVPGRTFEDALGAAAGSQNDGVGVAFSGSTSLENQYYVDGLNTTGLRYGTVGNPVINDFIEEIEVITGGYNAEYGRATGGIVNVVTKSGTNQTRGSVFTYYRPGFLTANRAETPSQVTFLDTSSDIAHELDVGFDLGGPIVKDRLWYYVGAQPSLRIIDVKRRINRRTDCRDFLPDGTLSRCDPSVPHDGLPDVDPATGLYITDLVEERVVPQRGGSLSLLGKLDLVVTPEHRGRIAATALPGFARTGGVYGTTDATTRDTSGVTTDASLTWTSKFDDNRTEVEASLGWHRSSLDQSATNSASDAMPAQVLRYGSLGDWVNFFGESQRVVDMCSDAAGDPYPAITNCLEDGGPGYQIGGPGALTDDVEQRLAARLSGIQRVKLLGSHELKAGVDLEDNGVSTSRRYSGGAIYLNRVGLHQVDVVRWVQIDERPDAPARFDDRCRDSAFDEEVRCDFLSGQDGYPGTQVDGSTINWSAYLRDSWQLLPNLTLNYGVRYEEQRMRYADDLQDTVDPLTDRHRGTNAMVLRGMMAPRVGVLYDWTREGRSKVYANWGRFYESIPLDINDRSFGGEVQYRQTYLTDNPSGGPCGPYDPRIGRNPDAQTCPQSGASADEERLFGSSGVLVAPGIRAQYLDEIVLGVELELIDDLKLGVAYQNRRLGRVIEDVSTDGARTYVIANPGEWSSDEEDALERDLAMAASDEERERLQRELTMFRAIRTFDKPRRDYNAVQITLTRRFSRRLYLQGSYTYSRTRGNFPGLVSYDNGQVDPNISSQYDLIELLANREGPLPQDRPHYIKVDGYYNFDLGRYGALVTGARIRALSGVPVEALGSHYRYGADESFLLPRGSMGRTGFEHGIDLHLGYERALGRGMRLALFADLFNVYNHEGQFVVDERYAAFDDSNHANPIVGGDYEDLIWAKALDSRGQEPVTGDAPRPLRRNPNFRNTLAFYAPFSVRLGARLEF